MTSLLSDFAPATTTDGRLPGALRVLVVEEALSRHTGHWRHYIGDIVRGLRAGGDQVEVLCHRDAPADLLREVGGTAWLRRSLWSGHRGRLADYQHIRSYLRDVSSYLQSQPGYDLVLCLTMRWQHALAWNLLVRRLAPHHFRRVVLLFVLGPGRFAGVGRPAVFAPSLRNRLWQGALRMLARAQTAGRVVLAAETGRMREELTRFSGRPFRLFCHPVVGETLARQIPKNGSSNASQREVAFCAPGFARYEKGADLLQEGVLELARPKAALGFQLMLQWLQPFQMPDGSRMALRPEFAALPGVRVLDRELNEAEYRLLLAEADWLVLPYRPESYHARVSRVAIEAATWGLPMIYTPGTWVEELCREHGAGVPVSELSATGVAAALRQAVAEHATQSVRAAGRAAAARAFHSVANFRAACLAETKT